MDTKTATQMAIEYGLKSSVAFNKLLVKCGILVHTEKGYILSQPMQGWGFTTVIEASYFLPNGLRATRRKSVWTESGQHFLRQHLGRIGIVPVSQSTDLFNQK